MQTSRQRRVKAVSERRLDQIFHALSDRTRRALLDRLERGPAGITELARPFRFRMSLPAVSKHVRVLESAGLVSRTIDGRDHRCTIERAPLGDIESWIHERRAFWSETLDSLADFSEKSAEEK